MTKILFLHKKRVHAVACMNPRYFRSPDRARLLVSRTFDRRLASMPDIWRRRKDFVNYFSDIKVFLLPPNPSLTKHSIPNQRAKSNSIKCPGPQKDRCLIIAKTASWEGLFYRVARENFFRKRLPKPSAISLFPIAMDFVLADRFC